MIQTWSRESTDTPIVEPKTQWFGSGFGHSGSTSNRGATRGAPNSSGGALAAAGGALSQAASSAPSDETSRIPARRVMVPPIRQRLPQVGQGLFLPRIIAEIGASSRAESGRETGAAFRSIDRAGGAGAPADGARARSAERRDRPHARAARRRARRAA